MDVDVSDYKRLIAELKGADKKLARGIRKRLRDLARPIAEEVLDVGSRGMPSRGGLSGNLRTSRRSIGITGAGVTMRLGGRAHRGGEGQLYQIDAYGVVRHPVFGRYRKAKVGSKSRNGITSVRAKLTKSPWATTKTPQGSYTAAFQAQKNEVRAALGREVEAVMREIAS